MGRLVEVVESKKGWCSLVLSTDNLNKLLQSTVGSCSGCISLSLHRPHSLHHHGSLRQASLLESLNSGRHNPGPLGPFRAYHP